MELDHKARSGNHAVIQRGNFRGARGKESGWDDRQSHACIPHDG
jgi:hypothetical protein